MLLTFFHILMYILVIYNVIYQKNRISTYLVFQLCKISLCYRIIAGTLISDFKEFTNETFEIYCGLTGNTPMLSILTLYSTAHYIYLGLLNDWMRQLTNFSCVTTLKQIRIFPFDTLNYIPDVSKIFQKNYRSGPLYLIRVHLRPGSILHGYFLTLRPVNPQRRQLSVSV